MNILDEAAELINGQRAKDYGDVSDNFQRIADLWFAYRYDNLDEPFTPHDVAMMMILVKVARQSNGYHQDSAVDIAGYAALAEKVAVFAPMSDDFWAGVDASIVEAQEKRERDRTSRPPRVWRVFSDVELGVKVLDKEGVVWYGDGQVETVRDRMFSPYTEVL